MIKFLFSLALSLFLFSFSPMVNSSGWTCSGGYSSASEACGTFHDYSVFAEFQKKISNTYNYSCKYYGGADRDTPYQYKNVTCRGSCSEGAEFNQDTGACDDQEEPPPELDCDDGETKITQDFNFPDVSLGNEPNKLDYCSGPGGKGGCSMMEAGTSVCTGSSSSNGVSCSGEFTANGRCPEGQVVVRAVGQGQVKGLVLEMGRAIVNPRLLRQRVQRQRVVVQTLILIHQDQVLIRDQVQALKVIYQVRVMYLAQVQNEQIQMVLIQGQQRRIAIVQPVAIVTDRGQVQRLMLKHGETIQKVSIVKPFKVKLIVMCLI